MNNEKICIEISINLNTPALVDSINNLAKVISNHSTIDVDTEDTETLEKDDTIYCSKCKHPVLSHGGRPPKVVARETQTYFGRILCGSCEGDARAFRRKHGYVNPNW